MKQKNARKQIKTPYHSIRIGRLPKGCRQCVKGEKLVLFVTGLCPRRCYYCPISDEKIRKDVVFANERPVKKIRDVIQEAEMNDAKGAGMTGGDPLARLDRTVSYIKALKKRFGEEFHIHLYTSLDLVSEKVLGRLYRAGLDEIRFHPDLDEDKLWKRIGLARGTGYGWDVGVEIPVVPGKLRETKKLMKFLDGRIKFLNLNELELSDGKASKLSELGYISKDHLSYGVKGSDKMAKDLLKFCAMQGFSYRVHYCTAKLKDKVQLTKRILRRGKNVKRKFDILTDEGLLVRGEIKGKNADVVRFLRGAGVPADLYEIDKTRKRVVTNVGVVQHLGDEMKEEGFVVGIVKEYPTWDRLRIEYEEL